MSVRKGCQTYRLVQIRVCWSVVSVEVDEELALCVPEGGSAAVDKGFVQVQDQCVLI